MMKVVAAIGLVVSTYLLWLDCWSGGVFHTVLVVAQRCGMSGTEATMVYLSFLLWPFLFVCLGMRRENGVAGG